MDREFLDRLSPPRPNRRRRKPTPREFDQEITKQLEDTSYFEWDKAADSQPELPNDEISFKTINDGLGFHPSQKSLPKNTAKSRSSRNSLSTRGSDFLDITEDIRESKDAGLWEKPKYFSFEDAKKKSFQDTSLQPFYESSHEKSLEKIFSRSEAVKIDRRLRVQTWELACSWGVDFVIVAAVSFLNLWLMFTISELPLNFMNFDVESYVLSTSLFVFWYLMYFTVGEFVGGTCGKRLLNIKVLNTQKKPIEFSQSLLRSFFSFISMLTLGLFSLFDGPSIGSKTQVLRRGKRNY